MGQRKSVDELWPFGAPLANRIALNSVLPTVQNLRDLPYYFEGEKPSSTKDPDFTSVFKYFRCVLLQLCNFVGIRKRASRQARTFAKSIAHLDDLAHFEAFDVFTVEVLTDVMVERVVDALRYGRTINKARKVLGIVG